MGLSASHSPRFLRLARRLLARKRFAQAEQVAFLACACDAARADAWLAHGLALALQGHYGRAVFSFEYATKLGPTHLAAWAHFGESCMYLERFGEAKTALEKAIALDPQAKDPLARRARMLLLSKHLWKRGGVFVPNR